MQCINSNKETSPSKSVDAREDIICDAGSDLLHHYQVQWSELHRATEEAAASAEIIDQMCASVSKNIMKRQAAMRELESLVNSLPDVENSMQRIADDLSEAIICMEELEQAIHLKEESMFQAEMRKRYDSQYVLKIHEEKLNREFEKIAISLESDHLKRVRELKKSEENAIREKQESFRRAFEKELMEYKMDGKIRRPENAKTDVSLEEILVEHDEDDRRSLETFLQEENDSSINPDNERLG